MDHVGTLNIFLCMLFERDEEAGPDTRQDGLVAKLGLFILVSFEAIDLPLNHILVECRLSIVLMHSISD